MATHFSILAWKIPQTEEPNGIQSKGSQRVRHDWATKHSIFSRLRNHYHYWIPESCHHSPEKPCYSLTLPHFPIALPPSPWQPGFYFQSQQICLFSCISYAIIRAHTWWPLLWPPWGTLSSPWGSFPGYSVKFPHTLTDVSSLSSASSSILITCDQIL